MKYLPRIVDGELARRLRSAGAVVIEGARACGKTETARQAAASEARLDTDSQDRETAEVAPDLLLGRTPPLLIDEWHLVPAIWNQVRRAVDDRQERGQFILTGSARPADDVTRHPGAGRFSFLRMRTMSLFEAGESTGAMAFSALMDGQKQTAHDSGLTLTRVAELITRGGWPAGQKIDLRDASQANRDYLRNVAEVDVPSVAGPRRDPLRVQGLVQSLARNVATEVSLKTLAADMAGPDGGAHRTTVADYLDVLERLMVVENQSAWAPAMRSRAQLRRAPKRHFVDPSLAVAAMNASPERLIADLESLGFMFESLVVRDLRILSQPLDGEVLHYRDNKGFEVDIVVQCADGRWGAFEVKLGTSQVDSAAANLVELTKRVDTDRWGAPAVLGVITPTGMGYQRQDGVHVIPIGALGP